MTSLKMKYLPDIRKTDISLRGGPAFTEAIL